VPPCTQKAFLILATMKGRITARTLSFTTQLCSSSEILFPEVILRCKLPPSKSTMTPCTLYLYTQQTKPESLVASVKICTTHSTLELIQRGTHNYHDCFIIHHDFHSCALHTRERKPRLTITSHHSWCLFFSEVPYFLFWSTHSQVRTRHKRKQKLVCFFV